MAVNLAGGTHHAHADFGQGFCVFNDAVVAARTLQEEGLVTCVLIIDCDVHQGNGTAVITHGDDTIFTFSIHGEKNFPFRKEESDLDVALPDGTEDRAYLPALNNALDLALYQADADLAIYLAGADPFVGDKLGRMALTKAGLQARDKMVYEKCRQLKLPVATVMSGGYAKDVSDIVDIHLATVKIAGTFRQTHHP
jgi:acetoin utilization deacetylase AcuC-like enzyme